MTKVLLFLLFALLSGACATGSNTSKSTYSGKPWRTLKNFNLEASKVEFSPNGKWLAAVGQNRTMVPVKDKGKIRNLQGARYAVLIWDTTNWKMIQALYPGEGITNISFTSDTKLLAASTQNNVTIYRTSDWKIIRTLALSETFGLAFSPHGDVLAADDKIFSTQTWQMLRQLPLRDVYSASFAPNHAILATGTWAGDVRLWDYNTAKELRSIRSTNNSSSLFTSHTKVLFSPNGKLLATSCWRNESATLWDTTTGEQVSSIIGGRTISLGTLGNAVTGVDAVAFSPDGKKLVTATGYAMRLWDIATGQAIHTFHGESGRLSAHDIAFSPDGRLLASTTRIADINLWTVPQTPPAKHDSSE